MLYSEGRSASHPVRVRCEVAMGGGCRVKHHGQGSTMCRDGLTMQQSREVSRPTRLARSRSPAGMEKIPESHRLGPSLQEG